MKKNTIPFGIVVGLIAPFFGVLGYYFWKFYPTFSFGEFMQALRAQPTLISGLSTVALFVNVVLLTFYLNTRRDETAKGIFAITCFYVILSLVARWLL